MSDASQILTLLAPVEGVVIPLNEVPDPVFAGLALGEGIALDPLGECLHAPCDGEIVQCARTRHALTLRTDAGLELLIHLGLDTVELQGQGIELMVAVGDQVRAGEPLCRFDADVLALGATALITPIVVTEPAGWRLLPPRHGKGKRVALGEELLVLTRAVAEQEEATTTQGPMVERCLTLALAAGLHARPAARLRAIAREYGVNLEVHLEPAAEGAGANVESLSALMNLGLVAGSALRLRAQGTRGEAALDAAEALLTTPKPRSTL
ncbi:hypothetical protein HORIV_18920 [Vreelandella olivaria]|uniref:PTS system glucose-specific EIIA component n=1 Tax=Vreelandella olivaria TaxID=390919 RepID=A0ABN5WY54_9GAMM|nr:hypothetical protein HORIV_18920 [Halomonas olivaria]